MANNHLIQFLRGGSSTDIPLDGQPFYYKEDRKLYIGDGKTSIEDLISSNKDLKPYLADNATNLTTSINNHDITEIFESDGITAKAASQWRKSRDFCIRSWNNSGEGDRVSVDGTDDVIIKLPSSVTFTSLTANTVSVGTNLMTPQVTTNTISSSKDSILISQGISVSGNIDAGSNTITAGTVKADLEGTADVATNYTVSGGGSTSIADSFESSSNRISDICVAGRSLDPMQYGYQNRMEIPGDGRNRYILCSIFCRESTGVGGKYITALFYGGQSEGSVDYSVKMSDGSDQTFTVTYSQSLEDPQSKRYIVTGPDTRVSLSNNNFKYAVVDSCSITTRS